MPDPTIWHKVVTIFWLVFKWLDAQFSQKAKIKKEAKDGFEQALKNHDSDGIFRSWKKGSKK